MSGSGCGATTITSHTKLISQTMWTSRASYCSLGSERIIMADGDDDDVQIPQPLHYVNLSLCEKLIFIKTVLHFNY